MSKKSSRARSISGILQGGVGGATAGAAIGGPPGALIGGGAGALIGGISGFLGDQADEEAYDNDPEVIAARRREKSRAMMSASLGRAFASMKTPKLGGSLGL